ncbi:MULTISPECIES: zinc ribbon domain-containing protein [unclassified Caballeronia]|jgi:hypothetical protein|uniref:double zinc ribbon domain-containing protein n=1 Tax=unclassified Caballeronia TaxID=2646786 RepID=UPI002027D9FF|nr:MULTISPECIES: zinc ribbon domain-containing protein [unclassified Caballeronia]MDR5796323.1 zinc ribbon domain-containing protein [Caballeronia sp. LZ008]
MSFLRKLFENGHFGGHGGHGGHGSHRREHDRRHRDGYQEYDGDESWGRHPGSIPPLPPDVICPQCRKSNPPDTAVCKQCDTPLDPSRCPTCGTSIQAGARYCVSCGKRVV